MHTLSLNPSIWSRIEFIEKGYESIIYKLFPLYKVPQPELRMTHCLIGQRALSVLEKKLDHPLVTLYEWIFA